MNDEMLEKLSAYVDGALPEAERQDLEARLAASPELRRELEALRAVSSAVKSLPKSPLPPGFMTRLQARRAREGAERREWFILPPKLRPVAFALSSVIVVVAVWDQFKSPSAPPLSAPASVMPRPPAPAAFQTAVPLKKDAAEPRAPGRPLESAEGGSAAGLSAPMAEEDRSQKNVQFMAALERQKSAMGISRVLPRRTKAVEPAGSAADLLADASPAPFVGSIASAPAPAASARRAPRGDAPGVPADDAGLVFADAKSFASSWILLGFSGNPPAVDFWSRRAVLLKRSGTKITDVRTVEGRVQVYFRLLSPGEASDPAQDRFTTLPLEPKPVDLLLL